MAGFFVQGVIGMILGGALGSIQTKLATFIIIYSEGSAISYPSLVLMVPHASRHQKYS